MDCGNPVLKSKEGYGRNHKGKETGIHSLKNSNKDSLSQYYETDDKGPFNYAKHLLKLIPIN